MRDVSTIVISTQQVSSHGALAGLQWMRHQGGIQRGSNDDHEGAKERASQEKEQFSTQI